MKKELTQAEIIKTICQEISGKKVLEIGCGRGDYTKKVYSDKVDYSAIDFLASRIEEAKKNIIGPKFYAMDAKELKFKDNYFDTVIGFNCFHELPQEIQEQALEEMLRVCKNKGLLIFVDPREESPTNKLWKPFNPNENHAQRIANSNKKIFDLIDSGKAKLKKDINFFEKHDFESKEKMYETMLTWWDDIKVPKNETEKQEMLKEIQEILEKEGFNSSYLYEKARMLILEVTK